MSENLKEYNEKRDFEKTAEPEGVEKNAGEGLKYVVQHHIARRDHYDFRLEWKGVMMSWAVPKGPSYNPSDRRLAIKVEDHPLDYRNFEGIIPQGQYGGGTVMIWDEGFWEPHGDVEQSLKEGALKFIVKGKRIEGKWTLIDLKEKDGDKKDNWILLKEHDIYAKSEDGISKYVTSIRSGRTMSEIEQGIEKKNGKKPL